MNGIKITILFIMTSIILCGIFIQSMSENTVFYGVRVPVGMKARDDFKSIDRSYKKSWVLGSLFIIVIAELIMKFLSLKAGILCISAFVFIQIAFMYRCFYIANKKVKAIKKAEGWNSEFSNSIAVVHKAKKKAMKIIPGKYFLIPIAIAALWIIVLFIRYNMLPDEIPLHFNGSGVADRFGYKESFGTFFQTVLLMPCISIIMVCFFYVIYKFTMRAGEKSTMIPSEELEARNFRERALSSSVLFWGAMLMDAIFLIISMFMTSGSGAKHIVIVTILLPVLYVIWVFYKTAAVKKEPLYIDNGDEILAINRDDDNNYLWGLMYYNKDDPAAFVPARVGSGYDINLGSKKGKIIFAVIIALIIGTIFMTANFTSSSAKADISVSQDMVSIKGSYGINIKTENIKEINYIDELPEVELRTGGTSIDNKKYGNYKLKNLGSAKLYIENDEKPCIKVEYGSGSLCFINYDDEEKTKELYEDIKKNIK